MIRGTTPRIRFKIKNNIDMSLIVKKEIYFGQKDKLILKKGNNDCFIENNIIYCTLTQGDTLCFDAKKLIEIQLRIEIMSEGQKVIMSTPIYKKFVYEILDEEEI